MILTIPKPLDWPVEQVVQWAVATTSMACSDDDRIRPLNRKKWTERIEVYSHHL